MRHLVFGFWVEFSRRFAKLWDFKDRVITETVVTARLKRQIPGKLAHFNMPGGAVGGGKRCGAHEGGSAVGVFDIGKLCYHYIHIGLVIAMFASTACRKNPRCAVNDVHGKVGI